MGAEHYILFLAILGAIVLIVSWVPIALSEAPLSLAMVSIAFGALLGASLPGAMLEQNPLADRIMAERLTEAAVIVSLMGAGLKIDTPIGLRRWRLAWRLLGIAMPLTIGLVALLGWGLLGLNLGAAILLGAVLAPTDPVLARDVQVGPPGAGDTDPGRFALTAEAGLNDGLAFPFVYLAIAAAAAHPNGFGWVADWFLVDVLWRILAGVVVGRVTGLVLGFLAFRMPERLRLARSREGLVAVGATFLSYASAELVHGYGFIAVFVAALAIRECEREHGYHFELHSFADQVERLLMVVVLVSFGAAMVAGAIFGEFTMMALAVALLHIFLVRPLCGWISLAGVRRPWRQKAVVSFFGIRGLGSLYYLAFALGHAGFDGEDRLASAVGLVVLVSVVLHGTTVTPVMRHLDRRREGVSPDKT